MSMGKNQRASEIRLVIIQVMAIVWIISIGAKLVRLQVADHEDLRARAERQHRFTIELSPTRGSIFDRNGNELARSISVKSLYASPAELENPALVAGILADTLKIDRDALYKRLTNHSLVLAAVKRKLTDREVEAVEALDLPGLSFVSEKKRFYVAGSTAAHIVGFTDIDERGRAGIEHFYDELIRGESGQLQLFVDALRKPYRHSIEESTPGASVTLTIDTLIQHYAEKALSRAVRAHNARGGTIILIRPSTGEILALANYPTFDPNNLAKSRDEGRRNRAVESAFEPGSIFKIVTYSAALEEGLIRPGSKVDAGDKVQIGNRVVSDRGYGSVTASYALAKSSNVAAIKIGQMLGREKLSRYIGAFGFGHRTGIELPAESRGLLRELTDWKTTSMASIPMGYEIAVTAVQAAAAFACIANRGEWVQPHLVSRVTSASGDILDRGRPERRRVLSGSTASDLTAMLEGVVLQGTGKKARVGGYRAAGKTGTARKVDEITGRYSRTRHMSTFAGFAPVDNPEIACIVSIDEPRGAHYGGDVAAPVFAQVVADALQLLGVPPEEDLERYLTGADFLVFDFPPAEQTEPAPAPEQNDLEASIELAEAALDAEDHESVVVPDLTGKGIREAVGICSKHGLRVRARGDGIVLKQVPAPGTMVARDTVCQLTLSRPPRNPGFRSARRQPGRNPGGITAGTN